MPTTSWHAASATLDEPNHLGSPNGGQGRCNVMLMYFHWASQTLLKNSRYTQPYGGGAGADPHLGDAPPRPEECAVPGTSRVEAAVEADSPCASAPSSPCSVSLDAVAVAWSTAAARAVAMEVRRRQQRWSASMCSGSTDVQGLYLAAGGLRDGGGGVPDPG